MNDQQHNEIPDIDLGTKRHVGGGGGGYEEPPKQKGGLSRWVLILLIVLGAFYLYKWMMSSPEEAYLQTTLDAPSEEANLVTELKDSTAATEDAVESVDSLDEPFDPEKAIELTREREPSELITLRNQLATLEKGFQDRLVAFEEKIQTLQLSTEQQAQTGGTGQDPRVEELMKEISEVRDEVSALKTLVGLVESLRSRVSALESKHGKKRRAKRKQVKRDKMPFRLVSIDIWNGDLYAGLMHKGDIGLYRADEVLIGWRIEKIDYDRQVVVFRSKSGKRVSKKVQR